MVEDRKSFFDKLNPLAKRPTHQIKLMTESKDYITAYAVALDPTQSKD